MTEVIMPKMGDGMEEGTLLEWLKKPGEKVKTGEVIGSIQTDKATLELEAPGTGVFDGVLLDAGGTVPVGQPIALILKDGESIPAGWGSGASVSGASATATSTPETVVASAVVEQPTASASGRVKASPLARNIASDNGIDLSTVEGTGPGGRIVEKDVQAFVGAAAPVSASSSKPVTVTPPTPIIAKAEDQVVPLNKLRQITAKRTSESKQQVPHFYVTLEVNVERILELRSMFEKDNSGKVSINDFVVKACALALREMPIVNSTYQGANLLEFGNVNIGIAVALDSGLTVPVVAGADVLSLRAISSKVKELAKKAKDNKLGMDELSGSTFTVSNMGMLDVDNFVAIINQPAAAIVAIASVRKKAIVDANDQIVVQSCMNITGSFDHRVVDGAVGAKFMNVVRGYLESPTRLLS